MSWHSWMAVHRWHTAGALGRVKTSCIFKTCINQHLGRWFPFPLVADFLSLECSYREIPTSLQINLTNGHVFLVFHFSSLWRESLSQKEKQGSTATTNLLKGHRFCCVQPHVHEDGWNVYGGGHAACLPVVKDNSENTWRITGRVQKGGFITEDENSWHMTHRIPKRCLPGW